MANTTHFEIRLAKKQANLSSAGAYWSRVHTKEQAFEFAYVLSDQFPDNYVAVWEYRDDGQFATRLLYYPALQIAA